MLRPIEGSSCQGATPELQTLADGKVPYVIPCGLCARFLLMTPDSTTPVTISRGSREFFAGTNIRARFGILLGLDIRCTNIGFEAVFACWFFLISL